MTNSIITEQIKLPLLPLKDIVVFPYMVIPLFIVRFKSIKTIKLAIKKKKIIFVTQKILNNNKFKISNIYKVGCLSNIIQILKLPDNTIKVLIEGFERIEILKIRELNKCLIANLKRIKIIFNNSKEIEAIRRILIGRFEEYIKLSRNMSFNVIESLFKIKSIECLIDVIASNLPLTIKQKQEILETIDIQNRSEILLKILKNESIILNSEIRIKNRVQNQIEKSQREYYLNEQIKAIQHELGGEFNDYFDLEELEKKIVLSKMSKSAFKKANHELKRLKLMPIMSAEATVIRNYIDTLVSIPWKKRTKINKNILNAEKSLNSDHFGLFKIKERILEYLSVQQRVNILKAPILCFVGPPGVGKTSLGKSIAKATNRKFVRISLGGIRDEAEIRGHRRTYIGSMSGKIMQNLIKSGVKNPLFLLDEIDKLGMDFRGDPSSALLEVLDSEQNSTFSDHYIEVEFDLSEVMFIATSNSYNMSNALLDRMEIIRLSGYTNEEKLNIAKNHLLPKQIKNNGLNKNEIYISESTIKHIINYYTRESGVRSLEREISKICRKTVKILLTKKKIKKICITPNNLSEFLGTKIFDKNLINKKNQIGQVNGLAWTEVGGELLTIESVILEGKGCIIRTGTLGDVMKESIEAAYTVTRCILQEKGINNKIFKRNDIHIHLPEGGIPKDGPSAGIALIVAMISVYTNIPVKANIAMTGEITLRGEILKIGGLKEKLLAAYQNNIDTVIIPEQNFRDLVNIPNKIRKKLNILPIKWVKKALEISLETKLTSFIKKKY